MRNFSRSVIIASSAVTALCLVLAACASSSESANGAGGAGTPTVPAPVADAGGVDGAAPMASSTVGAAVFVRGLTNLKTVLAKGEAHGAKTTASLAEGMQDLAAQVHWASEGSKHALDRVLGVPQAPAAPASASTFADLQASIDGAIAFLEAVDPAALEAGLDGAIELPMRGRMKSFRGDRFLIEFALPNFFFHVTLAYAILRNEGVPLEKIDFMGP
jgi:hypothetical protein